MDYKRIYAQFIDNRKARALPDGYSEKHHILPKSLGGTDSPENLISLTPEDHYFAHLLLAKIHGGSQWAAVKCMAEMANESTFYRTMFASRYMVGVARRKSAEAKSQQMSGSSQPWRRKVATLFNVDGRSVTGSRTELSALTGLRVSAVSVLCNGQRGQTMCGWFLSQANMQKANASRQASGIRSASNVAGRNRRMVKRLDCGTVYKSLEDAAQSNGTHTSNISRAIRLNQKAGAAYWAYA